ncbi:MAG: ModD protein [Paludibacter sp.]|nr:ModD protein [Paludibacter sp.]
MIYFTDNDIDRLIEDDAPAGDMTSSLLNIKGEKAGIAMFARHDMVVCCTEEAERMYQKNGIKVTFKVSSGTALEENDKIIEAEGDVESIHLVWRTGLAMIEFASGIATRTNQLVKAAHAINENIQVSGTRKHPPYLKKIALKALIAGGGIPHRTGLSDTILLFREHLLFTGGYENLSAVIASIKSRQKERKIVVEAHNIAEAKMIAAAGAHVIQMDKISPADFTVCKKECEALNPEICVIAAGGVNGSNATEYAKAGAEVLVTSWMYFGPPADIKVVIDKLK